MRALQTGGQDLLARTWSMLRSGRIGRSSSWITCRHGFILTAFPSGFHRERNSCAEVSRIRRLSAGPGPAPVAL